MSSTCPSCGTANREAASFCAACGAGLPWAQSCGTCGASNPANQRFCGSCGTALGGGPSTTPREPTSVAAGRYEILRSLGEGSRKRVYLAADRRLDRQVAIAMLKVDDLDGAQLEAVRREIEATGRLGEHPNLVTVFDVGAEGGVPYVVSRLMRYPSLDEVLGSERPPLSRVLAIA
ncbi:MAG: zinc-ribbon domain-containing protein, partial [Thermoleophilaceae bacterium]|nr:zinc-ribbon domain-containing protein [Thermoleophilaceae bacterium]